MKHKFALCSALALVLTAVATPVLAHPHVLVDAKEELVFDQQGRLTAIHHIWQFDDAFTAFAVQGLDANGDGQLEDSELVPLAKVNVDSLGTFGYFSYLTVNGQNIDFTQPTEYWLQFNNARLTLFYTLPLKTPVAINGKATLEVFDPQYFVAFNFVQDNPITLDNGPAGCATTLQPPKPLDAQTMAILAAIPPDQTVLPPDLRQAASVLANVIIVDCPENATGPVASTATPTITKVSGPPTPFGIVSPESGGSPIGGPLSPLFLEIALYQQQFYTDLIARMEEIKQSPWALGALMWLSFLYGIFHAAGPGHGKAVISGYVVANRETARRGILLSFISAFVQAITAILVVGIAGAILHVTAVTMTAATDWFEIASYGLIVLVGLWLLWTKTFGGHNHAHFHAPAPSSVGAAAAPHDDDADDHDDHDHDRHHGHHHHAPPARKFNKRWDAPATRQAVVRRDHDHDHGHDDEHEHDHDFAAVVKSAAATGGSPLSRAWSAILAVGIRPCSGALIVLVFALSQGLFLAGIAATFVMALGTGLTVAILATLAVSARGMAVRLAGPELLVTERLVRVAEIGVALAVLVFGLLMLAGSLATGLPTTA